MTPTKDRQMNSAEVIRARLFSLRDEAYAAFQARLIPTVAAERIVGIRTPALRSYAKELLRQGGYEDFIENLPHYYFDENQLHAFLLSGMKDMAQCLRQTERFLPCVDNWATCDQLSPKIFRKHHEMLLPAIRRWLSSTHEYTVRFAIGMLMQHFLEEDFSVEYLDWVADVRSEKYYIRMMQAWYFATALAKQPVASLPYIEQHRLEVWTHNKAIQKSLESYRITPEQKDLLRSLKVK